MTSENEQERPPVEDPPKILRQQNQAETLAQAQQDATRAGNPPGTPAEAEPEKAAE